MKQSRCWILVVGAAFAAICTFAPALADENRFNEVVFEDDGPIQIDYEEEAGVKYIYIVGTQGGLTLSYPASDPAPTISTSSRGLVIRTKSGHSFDDGSCVEDEMLHCFGGPWGIDCWCTPWPGVWCDTHDQGPVFAELSKNAGC